MIKVYGTMYNSHKKRLKGVRKEKGRNHNKNKIISQDEEVDEYKYTGLNPINRIGGTWTN